MTDTVFKVGFKHSDISLKLCKELLFFCSMRWWRSVVQFHDRACNAVEAFRATYEHTDLSTIVHKLV